MKDQFDVQQDLYNIFSTDSELLELLWIPNETNEDTLASKIRLIMADTTVMQQDDVDTLPFFDVTFVPMRSQTNNYLLSRGTLEFNIYGTSWATVRDIYRRIHKLLEDNYSDAQVYYEGQGASGITGVVRYVFRTHQFTKA